MGMNRYCSYDDEYIDNPWSELTVRFHDGLIDELNECAKERGMEIDMHLEYILLKQLEKERPRKRDKKIKEYLQEEWECDKEEIAFIMALAKLEDFWEDDVTYYLDLITPFFHIAIL